MEVATIYENAEENPHRNPSGPWTRSQNRTETQNRGRNRCFVFITVSLGLICVLLVVGILVMYIHLTAEKKQKLELETNIKNLNDALKKKSGSYMYFISSEQKNWSDSRQFCRNRGQDLVIINTEEEQRYISSIAKEEVWIGLSDIAEEGKMKWVDNTPLNKGFWNQGEPNDEYGNENCVKIMSSSHPPLSNWNDLPCSVTRKWICENL